MPNNQYNTLFCSWSLISMSHPQPLIKTLALLTYDTSVNSILSIESSASGKVK
jgi:hypothetical protein